MIPLSYKRLGFEQEEAQRQKDERVHGGTGESLSSERAGFFRWDCKFLWLIYHRESGLQETSGQRDADRLF